MRSYDSPGSDEVRGEGGDDWIEAWRGGDDRLDAGAGRDTVLAGSGNDVVIGGAGDDALFGAAGGGGGGADNPFGDLASSAIPFDWTITPIRPTSLETCTV